MKTVLNPSPLPEGGLSPIGYIDYLFVNEMESEHIAGVSANDPRELAAAVLRVTGAKNVVVTLGSEGSCALTEEGDFIEVDPVHVDNVANTAGAGDGFMAATVAGLVREKPLREAMEWASHYAALVVTIDGTIPAYRPLDEVEAFIERGCLVIG